MFLHTANETVSIARPGDPMPGGGNFVRASAFLANCFINERGDVVFNGTLDTDVNQDGLPDTGIWVWSTGQLRLVAKTGTVVPGVGTVAHLSNPFVLPPSVTPMFASCGALINNHGQVFFQAILSDGTDVLLIATPAP